MNSQTTRVRAKRKLKLGTRRSDYPEDVFSNDSWWVLTQSTNLSYEISLSCFRRIARLPLRRGRFIPLFIFTYILPFGGR